MQSLSKSKLIAYRQCPKRLWLEIQGEQPEFSSQALVSFEVGLQVGDIAKQLYDPRDKGQEIDRTGKQFATAFSRSSEALKSNAPVFEAGFSAGGAHAFADVMLPAKKAGKRAWRMVEVKSSTEVKDYHRDDIAIQAFLARSVGVPLVSAALAYIDSSWVYPGSGNYQGLLLEHDLTDEAFGRGRAVKRWIADAQTTARKRTEPKLCTGKHCGEPYDCGYLDYCRRQEPKVKFPVSWLPSIQTKALKALLNDGAVTDMRKVPDALLNERQLRVKTHTLSNRIYFDAANAAADLKAHKLPAYFLDFETIQFAVPIWKGTRPYQHIPFQFSLHRLSRNGKLDHSSFIDISGDDPSKKLAESLIAKCGERGPVFVYNASFEKTRVRELADRFPKMRRQLLLINDRIVDLRPIAERRFYHPMQQGSWSIKNILPAVAPDLDYDVLEGVQDGGDAMAKYLEAISRSTTNTEKKKIGAQLMEYCGLDTLALVQLWKFFSGWAA